MAMFISWQELPRTAVRVPTWLRCRKPGSWSKGERLLARLAPPKRGYLMPQAPGLEAFEQRMVLAIRFADFLLIVNKAALLVIRYAVIIFAHVSQHTQQALTNARRGLSIGALMHSLQ